MKKYLLLILAIVLAMPVFSIDTLWVELDEFQNNYDLKATIDADQGAHIYGLRRGGYYYVDGTIENTFPIVLVGETGPEATAPATLLYATDDQGASPNNMFEAKDDVTFKNLYLVGVDDLGAYRNFYRTEEPAVKLVVENCVCNYTNDWKGFFEFKSVEGVAILQNNIVMNMMRADGYVWATWFHTQNTKPDTLIITNNTVFNCPNNFISLNEREAITPNYALVEHNTVVNTGKDVLHFSYWMNLYHKNNLYYNVMYQGDSEFSATGWTHRVQCPDDEPYAFIKVDTINNTAWEDSMLTTLGQDYRIMEVMNNNFYQSPEVEAIPGMVGQHLKDTANNIYADSGNIVMVMSPRTQAMFDDDANWPGLMADAITHVDPGFTNDPTDVNDLVAHALMLYRNSQPAVNTHFDPDMDSNPDGYWMTYEWPIIGEGGFIDFTYSNATLASGSDMGYHLGDLYHWYPEEYAKWVEGIGSSTEDKVAVASTLMIYPNPASDFIQLNKVTDVDVYNLNGQIVKSAQNTQVVNISDVASGLYFVKDTEGNVAKLIVR
jgi:hypothetical protein